MKWQPEAEKAISRVPFFIRKRVRKRVEEEAERCGETVVTMKHVSSCQKRFMQNMEQEVNGFHIETCFGHDGCPNHAFGNRAFVDRLEARVAQFNLKEFLKKNINGPIKLHHELRISISCCPNACSRPQIADIGLIGASYPEVTGTSCIRCDQCVSKCKEGAISFQDGSDLPVIDGNRCLGCGACISSCPSGTLIEAKSGYRILVGGKLGRHPQLATELPSLFQEDDAIRMVVGCVEHFMEHGKGGERFGSIINRTGVDPLLKRAG